LFALAILLAVVAIIAAIPGAYEPPEFMQSGAERVSGQFTRCGRARSHYCVIDGDTFRIGERSVRVVGIDTAERDARCPAEAKQAELSAAALQQRLNRGAFQMTARVDEPVNEYGRELRIIKRFNQDGSEDRVAYWMRANGGARLYLGGWRGGWC
jgi:endonuclease YncB( thermonuclease family)